MMKLHSAGLVKLVLVVTLALLHQSIRSAAAHTAMITVGDEVDGMILTRGAAEARPLWLFCASEVRGNLTTASCRVPSSAKLAIGHVFLGTDEAFSDTDRADLTWELYLDDQLIHVNAFGTHDYILPIMAPYPSFVREVLVKSTGWDIVLTNLQPGAHTLDGRLRDDGEEYRWQVDLVIEDGSRLSEQASSAQDSGGSQSRCSRNARRLSAFHHSCRFYG